MIFKRLKKFLRKILGVRDEEAWEQYLLNNEDDEDDEEAWEQYLLNNEDDEDDEDDEEAWKQYLLDNEDDEDDEAWKQYLLEKEHEKEFHELIDLNLIASAHNPYWCPVLEKEDFYPPEE